MNQDLWLVLPGLFAAGLAGSGHCFGMCGGLAALAGSSTQTNQLIWLNLARISSYMLVGVIGALLLQWGFSSSEQLLRISQLGSISRLLSGILLLLIAFSLFGWRLDALLIRRIAAIFWKRLQPLTQRLLPLRNPGDALLFGMLWGWLPCGLVYAVAPAAWLRADALQAGLMMLAFGLGTLPAMLATGMASARIRLWMQQPSVRWISVLMIAIAGLWLMYQPLLGLFGSGHAHH